MDTVEAFKKFRGACDDVIKAYESEDEKAIETAVGRFLFLCFQLQSSK